MPVRLVPQPQPAARGLPGEAVFGFETSVGPGGANFHFEINIPLRYRRFREFQDLIRDFIKEHSMNIH